MLSLLLIILLLQIAVYLLNTFGAAQLNDLAWHLSSKLPLRSSAAAQDVTRLRREVVKLKRDMAGISAQDDFARWARVRREHDRVLGEHDGKAAALSASRSSFDTRMSAVRWLATSGARYLIQFWYAKTPVFELPQGWLPWYVEWVLGFPRCPYGGVSVNVWSMVCGVVVGRVADLVITVVGGQTQKQTQAQTKEKMGDQKQTQRQKRDQPVPS